MIRDLPEASAAAISARWVWLLEGASNVASTGPIRDMLMIISPAPHAGVAPKLPDGGHPHKFLSPLPSSDISSR